MIDRSNCYSVAVMAPTRNLTVLPGIILPWQTSGWVSFWPLMLH